MDSNNTVVGGNLCPVCGEHWNDVCEHLVDDNYGIPTWYVPQHDNM